MDNSKLLRGSPFINRCRIECTLTTKSPLHIGSGAEVLHNHIEKPNEEGKKEKATVSEIVRDMNGRPYIPGSTVRGNMRHWLLNLFRHLGQTPVPSDTLADDKNFESAGLKGKSQKEQKDYILNEASMLERLFGTPFTAGKVDFWDALCATNPNSVNDSALPPADQAPYWEKNRLSYVGQSVAIDPKTGAAIDKRLYHYYIVPQGIQFRLTLAGQNLSDTEIGMLLFGLSGFNSEIAALTLGAMEGRGFGRFICSEPVIYKLDKTNYSAWMASALQTGHAGFNGLTALPAVEKTSFVNDFKDQSAKIMEGAIHAAA